MKKTVVRPAIGLAGILLVIWLLLAVTLTWCTAKALDRWLEEENGRYAERLANGAWLQRLAEDPAISQETAAYRIWDGANTHWVTGSFGGGLLRRVEYMPHTAAVIYDGAGRLLAKSENALYLACISQENWYTQPLDSAYDSVAKVLYDPAEITAVARQTIRRTDWIALRCTGTIRDGLMDVSKIEYIDADEFFECMHRHYGDGSYERHVMIREMEEKYGLTWKTLLVSSPNPEDQVWYGLDTDAAWCDPGSRLTLEGETYADLTDYVLQTGYKTQRGDWYTEKYGSLLRAVQITAQTVYGSADGEPVAAYRVVAAASCSPWRLAAESLVSVYLLLLLLLALSALPLWQVLRRSTVRQMERQCAQLRWERDEARGEMSRLTVALGYAEEAEKNRRHMTSAIAHALKTPLAVIHGYAEGLRSRIAEEKRDRYLDVILSEAERTDAMVMEMLDLSRLEAGKVKLSRDVFSLEAMTRAVFEKLELAARDKNLQVELMFPRDSTVTADEGRIGQAVENLAANAVKYTPAGGKIRVRLERRRSSTVYYMENDSAPLPEEALTGVWDTFYRVDGSEIEGSGLGLAITKSIIELHGGSCRAYNTQTGVEFSFSIP